MNSSRSWKAPKYGSSVLYNIKYRLLAFWDTEEETLVIATHGFIKKTQKTPAKEIAKAEAMRKEYFNDKKQEKK
jgi:phage-related protein